VIVAPFNGVYAGAAINNGTDISPLESASTGVGRVLNLFLHNGVTFTGMTTLTEMQLDNDGPMGRISVIAWNCHDSATVQYNATAIINGQYDSIIAQQAQAVKALGYSVMIRLWREMNLNWNGGTENSNNCFTAGDTAAQAQAEYIGVWQHVVNIFDQQGVQNVTWVWCPCTGPKQSASVLSASLLDGFYPGDAWVDWTCADAYDKGTAAYPNGGGDQYVWGNLNPNIDAATYFPKYNKPFIMAETGECNDDTDGTGYKCVAGYYSQVPYLNNLQTDMSPGGFLNPLVKGFMYFDSNSTASSGWDWTLSGTPVTEGLGAYNTLVNAPYFNPTSCTALSCPQPQTTAVPDPQLNSLRVRRLRPR
jgi:hypothetical protein